MIGWCVEIQISQIGRESKNSRSQSTCLVVSACRSEVCQVKICSRPASVRSCEAVSRDVT
eukprot:scaffold74226_cov51-Attheya_sp.AAC.4